GIAFQLADEVLELQGRASQFGKACCPDLREGLCSLPVLGALRRDDATAVALRALLSGGPLSAAGYQAASRLVLESGSHLPALETARRCASRARAALGTLPAGPARTSLANLADYVVERDDS